MAERQESRPGIEAQLDQVIELLHRHELVENLVSRQDEPRHELVEDIVHKQHLVELQRLLDRLDASDIVRILETLPEEDRLATWEQVDEARCEGILEILSDDVREELVGARPYASVRNMLNAFELRNGRLSQVQIDNRADLANVKPIWVDLVAPSPFLRLGR